MRETYLDVERRRRVRKDIQRKSAPCERAVEVILIAIVCCVLQLGSLVVGSPTRRPRGIEIHALKCTPWPIPSLLTENAPKENRFFVRGASSPDLEIVRFGRFDLLSAQLSERGAKFSAQRRVAKIIAES
jgi:hypothetical protein